jgi:hypothetical protein
MVLLQPMRMVVEWACAWIGGVVTRKRPKNLLLKAEALTYGERYAEYSGTTISRLVEDYLENLPRIGEAPYRVKSPVVGELWAIAIRPADDVRQQQEFLQRWRKRKGKE